MTNEQLAALLRPYWLDLSDMAKSAQYVVPGHEALLLSAIAGRLELVTKTLGESIARLDNPLVLVSADDERPVWLPPAQMQELSEQVNEQLRTTLDSILPAS